MSRRLSFSTTVAIATTIILCGCADTTVDRIVASKGVVLQNVTVVDTRDGKLSPGQTIVLDGGKIVTIAPAARVVASGAAQVIEAGGKFVVPGFNDMHVHAMAQIDQTVSYFPLMLANGITGFREMGAFPGQFPAMVARARQLDADIVAGKVDAPEALLVPSDIYQGATSAASAVQAVDRQQASGVDFIKVISANREAMLAFLSEAKAKKLYVAGHLTPAVSASESSQLGWKTIEHLGSGLGILLDCSSDEAGMRQAIVSAAGASAPAFPADAASLQRVLRTYSSDKCTALSNLFVRNGTWNVPTLRRVRGLDQSDDAFFLNDPNMIYVDGARKSLWARLSKAFSAQPPEAKAALKQLYGLQQSVTVLMKRTGVKLMAGSDAGVASVWVIPGVGLHQEFHELAAAGLSPLDVLQMTTLDCAEFLGRQATMGTVEVGKNADLVLLDANPIDDVTHLDKIAGLVLKGRYFTKAALAKLASDTAKAYATAPAKAFAVPAVELTHRD